MGDHGLIPGSGRFPGEGNIYPFQYSGGFAGGSNGKESACNVGEPCNARDPGVKSRVEMKE